MHVNCIDYEKVLMYPLLLVICLLVNRIGFQYLKNRGTPHRGGSNPRVPIKSRYYIKLSIFLKI